MIEVIKVEDCGENIGDYDIPIHNAIIIPKNPTNGYMIKAMFPDVKIHQSGGYTGCLFQPSVMLEDRRTEWWNAPYKRSAEKADRKEIDWISIDENVPTIGRRVLVCFDDGFILIGAYMDYAEDEKEPFWVFDGEQNFNLKDSKVIGWMPLPESYKEVEK